MPKTITTSTTKTPFLSPTNNPKNNDWQPSCTASQAQTPINQNYGALNSLRVKFPQNDHHYFPATHFNRF
ncbi:hypothetical protein DMR_01440 [Solidesulfovibrio magneticus RS-1]|uniref:Uncharacterized protein n=1 Tax=Solidesulfovibrio magneticus (strain ATCC 700980 / DSM 13731 / RS-1) TaxID=573370 RepID=C4XTX0_SOLM1|nr:hypothetical protein DMR_01440 [Solidesulfovibrio magneticus RS-1]